MGARDALECLEALIEERWRLGPVCVVESLDQVPATATSILQIGGSASPGIFLSLSAANTRNPRRVPIGWLPDDGKDRLLGYASAAAQVVRRQVLGLKSGPAVLLGQWHERTLKLVDTVEGLVGVPKFRWTAERLLRRDLLRGLRCGPGVALYFGHALPRGWVGYGGVAAESLITNCGEPLGAVVSIACQTACRHDGCPSFCEELVLGGFCAAALGASDKTLHEHNCILARALCSGLGRARSLGDLLGLAEVPEEFYSHYRIFGDPAAPLIGAAHAEDAAGQVFAPAPDELLKSS